MAKKRRSAASRDATRARVEKFRAKRQHRAVQAAQSLEQMDEALAPSIMRTAIIASSGEVLRGPLVQIVNGVPRRATGLSGDAIGKAAGNRAVTLDMLAAARLFQADHSEAGGGINASAVDYSAATGGGGGGDGRHRGVLMQIAARGRLEGALTYMGALAPVVVRVVIDSVSPTAIADAAGIERETVQGMLIAGLVRLAQFYRARENANANVADIEIGRVRRAA